MLLELFHRSHIRLSRHLAGHFLVQNRVTRVFSFRKLLVRTLGAVLFGMDEDWSSRKWFAEGSIAPAASSAKATASAAACDGTPSQGTRQKGYRNDGRRQPDHGEGRLGYELEYKRNSRRLHQPSARYRRA